MEHLIFEGGGWEQIVPGIEMMIILVAILMLILIALGYGWYNSAQIDIMLEMKLFNNPYYVLGVSFDAEEVEEGYVIEELVIGLFFINVVLVFHKINA